MEWKQIYAIQIGLLCLLATIISTNYIVKDLRKGDKKAAIARFQYWLFIILFGFTLVLINK